MTAEGYTRSFTELLEWRRRCVFVAAAALDQPLLTPPDESVATGVADLPLFPVRLGDDVLVHRLLASATLPPGGVVGGYSLRADGVHVDELQPQGLSVFITAAPRGSSAVVTAFLKAAHEVAVMMALQTRFPGAVACPAGCRRVTSASLPRVGLRALFDPHATPVWCPTADGSGAFVRHAVVVPLPGVAMMPSEVVATADSLFQSAAASQTCEFYACDPWVEYQGLQADGGAGGAGDGAGDAPSAPAPGGGGASPPALPPVSAPPASLGGAGGGGGSKRTTEPARLAAARRLLPPVGAVVVTPLAATQTSSLPCAALDAALLCRLAATSEEAPPRLVTASPTSAFSQTTARSASNSPSVAQQLVFHLVAQAT